MNLFVAADFHPHTKLAAEIDQLFDRGLSSYFYTPIIVGLVLSLALALIADGIILLIQRGTLPWARGRKAA